MAPPSISPRRSGDKMPLVFLRHAGLSLTVILLAFTFHQLTPLFVAVTRVAVEHELWDVLSLLALAGAIFSGLLSGKDASREDGRFRQMFDLVNDTELSTFPTKNVNIWTEDEREYIGGTRATLEHWQTWSEDSMLAEQVIATSPVDDMQRSSRGLEKKSRATKRPNEMTDICKSPCGQSSGPSTREQERFQANVGIVACGRCGGETCEDSYKTAQTDRESVTAPLYSCNFAVDHSDERQVHGPGDDDPEINRKADAFIASFREQLMRELYQEMRLESELRPKHALLCA